MGTCMPDWLVMRELSTAYPAAAIQSLRFEAELALVHCTAHGVASIQWCAMLCVAAGTLLRLCPWASCRTLGQPQQVSAGTLETHVL